MVDGPLLAGVPRLRSVGRARADPLAHGRRWPAWFVLIAGLVLAVGAITGGLPKTTAGAQKMLDSFTPLLTTQSLDRLTGDVDALGRFGAATRTEAAAGRLARAPRRAQFAARSQDIERNARGLLDAARSARPDVDALAAIRGLKTLPYVLFGIGLALAVAGVVLLRSRSSEPRGWARSGALLAALFLVVHPFVAGLAGGAASAQRVVDRFAPIMNESQVVQLQTDFLGLVGAVGEADRSGAVPRTEQIRAFTGAWQTISSDLATLTGAINDNLPDYRRLSATNAVVPLPGGTFGVLPWAEVTLGVAVVGALVQFTRKEQQ